MSAAITFDRVSKHYRGSHTYRALRDDIVSAARRAVRLERRERGEIRALDDVSFEIEEGASTALIGLNGAGKTTALKIISRITYPTTGVVRVRGRIGALIEVGTGMHPELTGRENIQLYGRILGHSGRDIERRMDAIVDFSGIAAALDQPVKQYSSGMQLRLGFSVAAHLEPDVLLVDEAIAVGDAGFQYRCVERMGELVREGRTLVFVSHDMSAIESLCDRAILLDAGRLVMEASARAVVGQYMQKVHANLIAEDHGGSVSTDILDITRVSIHDKTGEEVDALGAGDPMTIRLHYKAHEPVPQPIFSLGLGDGQMHMFSQASMMIDGQVPDMLEGEGYLDCTFAHLPLQPKTYEVWGEVRGRSGIGFIVDWQRLRRFRVTGEVEGEGRSVLAHSLTHAPVKIPYAWRLGDDSLDAASR
jgi:ABC-type polysaccharide/polyol phosphate transport system ATPase subunit